MKLRYATLCYDKIYYAMLAACLTACLVYFANSSFSWADKAEVGPANTPSFPIPYSSPKVSQT